MITILLKLTEDEKDLLRSTISELGTTYKPAVSLQLKIANAILEASDPNWDEILQDEIVQAKIYKPENG